FLFSLYDRGLAAAGADALALAIGVLRFARRAHAVAGRDLGTVLVEKNGFRIDRKMAVVASFDRGLHRSRDRLEEAVYQVGSVLGQHRLCPCVKAVVMVLRYHLALYVLDQDAPHLRLLLDL